MNKLFETSKASYKSMDKHRSHIGNQRTYNHQKKLREQKKHRKLMQVNRIRMVENYDAMSQQNNQIADEIQEADYLNSLILEIIKMRKSEEKKNWWKKYCYV